MSADQVAVVTQHDVDPVGQAGVCYPLLGELALGGGQGGGGDPAATGGGCVHGETAPAGADLEQVVVGPQIDQFAHPLEFPSLGLFQAVARLEHSAGVGHGLVEEEPEQVVR